MQLLAVIELFPTRMLGVLCVTLGVACVAVAVGILFAKPLGRFVSELEARSLSLSPLDKVVLVLALAVSTVCAQKGTNEVERIGGGGARRFLRSGGDSGCACEWRPVGENVVRAETLYRCGATEDALRLTFDEGLVFPDGTNHLDRVVILSSGEVRRTLQDRDALVSFGERLWSRPYDSVLTAEHTPSNSYRLVWRNFYANGDTNLPRTASAELFRNGDLAVTENGVTTITPYEIPFPHDGFGQDDEWVRANCTNAAEVLSVGYADWVDDQVGVGLENGLYKFTATFPADPPEATRLFVGDKTVCVTNAGEYVFLLEKGVEYEFGTVPYCSNVTYRAEDDIPVARPLLMSYGAWWYSDWSIDGGASLFELPTLIRFGRCSWMPTFQATPAMGHLGPGDSPRIFTAVLSDYAYAQNVSYHWSSADPNVVISSPNARETEIGVGTMPLWRDSSVRVTAAFGTNVFESVCRFNYGEHEYPQARVVIAVPDAVLLNSNAVDSAKIAQGSVSFTSDVETNGTLTLHCSSGGNRIRLTSPDGAGFSWSVTGGETYELSIEGVATSAGLGDVVLDAVFVPDGGAEPVAYTAALTVVAVGNVTLPGAPDDGLVISTGTSVAFDMDVHPVGAECLLSAIYSVRRLRGNGAYTDWNYAAGNYEGTAAVYNPPAGGIYQVQALVGVGWGAEDERYFSWEEDENREVGFGTKGELKSFGVVSEEWQKSLRNCALRHLGSLAYLNEVFLPAQYGFPEYPAGDLMFKCNIFVAHRIVESGLYVPATRGGVDFPGTSGLFRRYPPLANDWANESYFIRGWEVDHSFPEPGFVVADPDDEMGHVGIMDFDGYGISAGIDNVNRKFEAWVPGTVKRKYTGEN